MAVPVIQIGQCGNQVGSAFYNTLYQQALKASPAHQALLHPFFQNNQAKALLVDMQPKVVGRCLARTAPWSYNSQLSLVREEGSGNNWAYGCYVHGPNVREELAELLQGVAERQDYVNMWMQLQSMAGGTGSGVGTFILGLLQQLFPKVPKIACCVMPHQSGEVILQAYNASLSLGSVYGLADGVILIENDAMNKICIDQLNIKKPQLDNINREIARTLAGLFFPAVSHSSGPLHSLEQNGINYARELTEEVFFDNRYKLAGLRCAPYCEANYENFSGDSWQAIQNQLLLKSRQVKSRLYVARGLDATDGPVGVRTIKDKHCFGGFNRSAVVVQNGASLTVNLQKIIQRAYGMVSQNAYLYQYNKYGLKYQQLEECLAVMQQIQANYKQLK